MNVGGWTPDSLIRTEQHFKTSGLAKPLSPTARLLLPTPRLTALPGRLPAADYANQPAADCANQPAADCSPTRH